MSVLEITTSQPTAEEQEMFSAERMDRDALVTMQLILADFGGHLAEAAPVGVTKNLRAAFMQGQSVVIEGGDVVGTLDPSAGAPYWYWVLVGAHQLHKANPMFFLIEWVKYTFGAIASVGKDGKPSKLESMMMDVHSSAPGWEDATGPQRRVAFLIGKKDMTTLHKGVNIIDPVWDEHSEHYSEMIANAF